MILAAPGPGPDLGPARCLACGALIVWGLSPDGRLMIAVDYEPAPDGALELYSEVFPDGEPVDGIQRVRFRPPTRAPSSPAWRIHWEAPLPCGRARQ